MGTYSKLCSGTAITDKCNPGRSGNKICRITPHQMIAHWTAATAATWFRDNGCENSVNYCIGYDGSIWCNVYEEDRAWTSSSAANDNLAITVELSNNENIYSGQMTDATINAFINLCVDIISRYSSNFGGKMNYTGNTSGNITLHEWFAATDCPGAWFKAKLPYIQKQVNAKLAGADKYTSTDTTVKKYLAKIMTDKTVANQNKQVEKAFKGVFNASYYYNKYPKVLKKYKDDKHALLQHFLNEGMKNNMQASAEFDPTYYEQTHPTLVEKFGKDYPKYYIHYLKLDDRPQAYLYKDVPSDYKYFEYVEYITKKGVMDGNSKGYFKPDKELTRVDLAYYIWKMAGKPKATSTELIYTDCSELSDVKKQALLWAYDNKVLRCYSDKTFRPNNKVKKRTAAICLYRLAGSPTVTGTISGYNDISETQGTERYNAILWCITKGISKGNTSTKLWKPKKYIEKIDLAIMLERYIKKIK